MELPKEAQEKIKKLQNYEQKIQSLNLQRQKLDSELSEIESALKAIEASKEDVYKIIGNVMVAASKPNIRKELEERKKKLQLRINSLEKQEDELRQVASAIQKEVLKNINGSG